MATVGGEDLRNEFRDRQDDLIREFIAGRHDYRKSSVREVLGEGLYLECCKRRVDKALSDSSSIVDRLKNLQRKDVGEFDEGGGNMCHYADESMSGRWVEWDDIQKLIDEFSTGGT